MIRTSGTDRRVFAGRAQSQRSGLVGLVPVPKVPSLQGTAGDYGDRQHEVERSAPGIGSGGIKKRHNESEEA